MKPTKPPSQLTNYITFLKPLVNVKHRLSMTLLIDKLTELQFSSVHSYVTSPISCYSSSQSKSPAGSDGGWWLVDYAWVVMNGLTGCVILLMTLLHDEVISLCLRSDSEASFSQVLCGNKVPQF